MYSTDAGSELPRRPDRAFTVGPACQNPTQRWLLDGLEKPLGPWRERRTNTRGPGGDGELG